MSKKCNFLDMKLTLESCWVLESVKYHSSSISLPWLFGNRLVEIGRGGGKGLPAYFGRGKFVSI